MATMIQAVPTTKVDPSPVLATYRPAVPLFVRGAGCRLVDDTGRSYLDFASGIGVNALGYGDPGVTAAVQSALSTGLVHTSNRPANWSGNRLPTRSSSAIPVRKPTRRHSSSRVGGLAGLAVPRSMRSLHCAARSTGDCSVRWRQRTGRACGSRSSR
jgi:hypothetical protein